MNRNTSLSGVLSDLEKAVADIVAERMKGLAGTV
jgi:hypothetical protein